MRESVSEIAPYAKAVLTLGANVLEYFGQASDST